MFLSKTHLNRRTFLRGVGATVALPLLDAMIPARTALAATAAGPVPRVAFVYFPHGAVMREWPARILEPLTPFSQRLTSVTGLENRNAYGPVHALTPGTWLSGAPPRANGATSCGITADQIAATHLGVETPVPSIQVATEETPRICAGAWEGQYEGCYGTTISFAGHSAPLPMESRPRTLFERLFVSDREAGRRSEGTAPGILDLVAEDAAGLRAKLGPADRLLLADYLEAIGDVERRVNRDSLSFDERLHLMFDMVALAFQADITRVASFMMAGETSQRTYEHIGVPEAFHALSHHQNDPDKIEKLAAIQTYHTRVFAEFVGKLASLRDGDGSVLDRSLILYGSNMSDSHAHDHFPLPLAVVGGGCGRLRGGQHLRYPDRTPMSNLLVAILRRAGVPAESMGDSTGECADI
jgi:hypothetical protein